MFCLNNYTATTIKVCFFGSTRYRQPLSATLEKKFSTLSTLGEIFVVGFSHDWKPHSFTHKVKFFLPPNLPVPFLRYIVMFTIGPMIIFWLILRHNLNILVAQSPYEGFVVAWVKLLARIFGKRVGLIVESHGDFENALFLYRRIVFSGFVRLVMKKIAKFAISHADALRAISDSTRKHLQKWATERPIVQFPTWTDVDVFLEAKKAKLNSEDQDKYILYAGVLTPLKGVHFLLDAFAKVAEERKDVRLRIIGEAQNAEYKEKLKSRVKELGLNGRVIFLNQVSQRSLAEYMAQAEVLVLPSLSEGLGRVIIEAMATGTPVIGSRVGGITEIIKDRTGYLVPPGNVDAIADKLFWILSHPQEAKEMGEQAHGLVKNFFSTERYIQGYTHLIEIVKELLNS